MQTRELAAHPAFAPQSVRRITATCGIVGPWLHLGWTLEPYGSVVLPPASAGKRASDLWKTTCFEIFVKARRGEAYSEFNFAPSGDWAAYDFTGYREGMAERALSHDPVISAITQGDVLTCKVALPLADLPPLPADLGQTAVVEEAGGHLSYWAAGHAHQDKPDFHDASCFAVTLGPPLVL